jgi:cytidyltransferase-like protein
MIFYIDMVADLFHYGHFNSIKEINDKYKKTNDKIYVGIHNDIVVESYKRKPILNMNERIKIIECCKYIDKIIPNAPLRVTKEYIDLYKIDLIFIPNNRTDKNINLMIPPDLIESGIIRKIKYTNSISTSDIIKRIKNRNDL